MSSKKIICLLSTFVLILSLLSGCGISSNDSNAKIKIFLSANNDTDTFQSSFIDSATKTASSNHDDLSVAYAKGKIDTQIDQIKEAASKKYDVIICIPVDPTTALQIEAAAGDIPIIFYNTKPSERVLEKGKYIYVASDEYQAGKLQAEYALDQLKDKKELNVVIMMGEKGHSGTIGRTEAIKDTLKKSKKTIHYNFVDYANWSTDTAKDMFDLFLQTKQKYDVVFCNNDSMALGVIEALKDNSIDPSSVPVLGVDATKDGCKAISDGNMAFTVFQDAAGQATAAINAAKALASNTSLSSVKYATKNQLYVYVPFEKVTSENVSKYLK